MPKCEAMEEYVQQLADLVPEWQASTGNPPEGSWVSVSTMQNPDEHLPDENKTIFDWCKEGNVQQIKTLLSNGGIKVNDSDDTGMTLMHWACDRGNVDMVQALLALKADVNIQDEEKQTPLHYAVSCEHAEVVRLLLSHGANKDLRDSDGCLASDLESNQEIQQLLA
ncbi:hypothetical protein FSP39_002416 [Pinctada imbricata]|uniref:Acyl-CoA-binding domain-containing protein 6 n=1 Tax=Pinctada imbricata TaxID=66713 RepID=A0AA88Y123_PINIB|nr:hypothetical protein FSP39_002416 [Pinctada imbricata]